MIDLDFKPIQRSFPVNSASRGRCMASYATDEGCGLSRKILFVLFDLNPNSLGNCLNLNSCYAAGKIEVCFKGCLLII